MRGFGSQGFSDKRIAHEDGLAFVEARTGRKLTGDQRKYTGEFMYKGSASVPDSMTQFAEEIHRVDRITPKEEKVLGAKTQEAVRLQRLYDNLTERLEREPSDEEWCAAAGKINMEALSQAIDDGLEAKNKLVTSNLRMVQGVVNVYIRNGLGAQYNAGDLMQEGIMALVRAAEKFDPSRGFRFSTYAMYWIRSSVKRSQLFQSRIVTVPPRLHETHKRLLRIKAELTLSLERPPTKGELGKAVGMSDLQIDRCMTAMAQRCFSLDQTLTNNRKPSDADESTMYDIVASRTIDSSHDVNRQLMREDLIETMRRVLAPDEVRMLMLRFGLNEDGEMDSNNQYGCNVTIAELGEEFGYKPDKVRRIINKCLKELKLSIGEDWSNFDQDLP